MTEAVTFTFMTSELHELDLNLINVLLTQAKNGPEATKDVINACKFVLNKLDKEQ